MNRLMEFTVPVEPLKGIATAEQKRSQRERESRIPMVWPSVVPPPIVPPLCNFIVEQGHPKLVTADLAVSAVPLGAESFAGQIQFPSSNMGLIALTQNFG